MNILSKHHRFMIQIEKTGFCRITDRNTFQTHISGGNCI